MTLRDWLFKQRMRITFFAGLLRVDRSYVHRWLKGDNTPSEAVMEKIREISMNEVKEYSDLQDEKLARKKRTHGKKEKL